MSKTKELPEKLAKPEEPAMLSADAPKPTAKSASDTIEVYRRSDGRKTTLRRGDFSPEFYVRSSEDAGKPFTVEAGALSSIAGRAAAESRK